VAYAPGRVGTGVVDGVSGGATAIGSGVMGGVGAVGSGVVGVGSGVVGGMGTVGTGVADGVGAVGSGVRGGFSAVGSGMAGGVGAIGSGLGLRRSWKHSSGVPGKDSPGIEEARKAISEDSPDIPEGTPPEDVDLAAGAMTASYSTPFEGNSSDEDDTEPEPEPERELAPEPELEQSASAGDVSLAVTRESIQQEPISRVATGTITVKSRKKHESSLELKPGSCIFWEFKLASKDIGFSAKFLRDIAGVGTLEEEIIVPYQKIYAEQGKVTGSFAPAGSFENGSVVFEWDNSFSKVTAKTVAFKLSYGTVE